MCYDGDGARVWDERTVRARKRWRCDECGVGIPAGVTYVRIGALEDTWYTMRVHAECLALWRRVHEEICGGEGLMMIGGLQDELDHAGANEDRACWEESLRDPEAYPDGFERTKADLFMAEYEAIQERYQDAKCDGGG